MVADADPDMVESSLLDREKPLPTYREIADKIAARIRRGEWAPGERLPTTDDFAAHYGVSEATAYRALSLLVDRGVVRGVQGGGRFVADVSSTP